MNLIAKKLVLQSMAEKASSIVSSTSKEIAPVLKNFHFEARSEPKQLRMVATDLDLSILEKTALVDVDEEGSAIIPAKKFLEIVKEAGDVDIRLATKDNVATISTPTTKWTIKLMQGEYPSIPSTEDVAWSSIKSDIFIKALRKVRNAVAKESIRPELTLVMCDSSGVYATDGARLHHAKEPIPVHIELQVSAVDDIIRIGRMSPNVDIGIAETDSHLLFDIGENIYMATKLQIPFPSITQLAASGDKNDMELQVDKEELDRAIKRARITADEETNRLNLILEDDSIMVVTRDKQDNSCEERIKAYWKHPRTVCSVNWVYLKEAIQEMESKTIKILVGKKVGKRISPIVISEDNFSATVLQLRGLDA
ncbi:MAG TPA: hypothetical protein ENI23_08130 [bacterium]|nr:hypothetical protein [bacterium]